MTATAATATAPDYDEIVRTVQLYIDGFNGDIDKFKRAFDEDAWMFVTGDDGVLYKILISERFEEWAARREHIDGRFLSVIQAGDVANVFLAYGDTWVDVHTLLRINGVWKVTNKTATHSSRAAWAGVH